MSKEPGYTPPAFSGDPNWKRTAVISFGSRHSGGCSSSGWRAKR